MESFDLRVKNYRCFDQQVPAELTLGPGFVGLVGPNNSGKSSLLRLFYELRPLWQTVVPSALNALLGSGISVQLAGLQDVSEIFGAHNDQGLTIEIKVTPERSEDCDGIQLFTERPTNGSIAPWRARLLRHGRVLSNFGGLINPDSINVGGVPTSIKAVMGLVRELCDAIYVGPFRNAINVGSASYYDLQIGTRFVEDWDSWKNGASKERNHRIQQITEDIRRIFGFSSLEINSSNDRQTLQLFIDRKSYRLNELGSGLAQFIVTFGAVAIRTPSTILIDEPELNLHPSLQLDFLTSLGKYADGVWFCTHSIGLARSVCDRLYSLHKRDGCSVVAPFSATKNYSTFVGEMSFSAYQELGFERLLLVEGPTEIRVLQQWLRLYGKEHKVVMIHLGGSSSISANRNQELAELRRITSNISVLIDSERSAPEAPLATQRSAFIDTCEGLGFQVHTTARRATENYFTTAAVKAVKGPKYEALRPHEALADVQFGWSKSDNWRIACQMTREDLDATDIGPFLKEL